MPEIERNKEAVSLSAALDSLKFVAEQSGTLSLESISRLAAFPEFGENDLLELLQDWKEQHVTIVPDEKWLPEKNRLKEMRKAIREFGIEKESRSETTRGEDPLRLYFDDLVQTEPLSPDEERDLLFDIADGEDDKLETLIESALFLPAALAFPLAGKGVLYLDLVQEGNMELMSAAADFDYSLNISFYAYAAFRIYRYLLTLIEPEESPAMLPAELAKDIADYLKEKNRFSEENGREPEEKELAALLKFSPERLSALHDALNALNGNTVPAEKPVQEEKEPEVQKSEAEQQLSRQVADLIAALPQQEAKIITMRYGIGCEHAMSEEEIAVILGMTAERVREIEENAMKLLGS